MDKKNPFSDNNTELQQIIDRYEASLSENKSLYLDADQYADIVDAYMRQERNSDAHQAIKRGLEIHPDNTTLLLSLVGLYLDENKISEARCVMDSIVKDNSVEVKLLNAELFIRESDYVKAIEILDNIDTDDTDEISQIEIAYLYIDTGSLEKALDCLNKALRVSPGNEEIISLIGDCYLGLGKYEKAIRLYNQLIDKQPYSSYYWIGLAKAHFNLSQYDQAIDATDFALVTSEEEGGEAHNIKGHSLFQLNNYEAAMEEYKLAWKQNALSPDFAAMFIGYCYINLSDWENAHEYLLKAIELIDKDSLILPELMINCARCLHQTGRIAEAQEYCLNLHRDFPDNVEAYLLNGQIAIESGNREEAVKYWEKAVELSPYAETWGMIGTTCLNNLYFEFAEIAFGYVRELNPDYDDLDKNLACVYLGLGDYDNFRHYINKLNIYPDELKINQLLDLLPEDLHDIIKELLNKQK